jgi:predicted kinase
VDCLVQVKLQKAKELEKTYRALRLTPDEWMEKIIGNGFDEEKRAAIESIMVSIAERCLTLGISVISVFG